MKATIVQREAGSNKGKVAWEMGMGREQKDSIREGRKGGERKGRHHWRWGQREKGKRIVGWRKQRKRTL